MKNETTKVRGVLVTGGSHGIGLALVRGFLAQGDKVAWLDVNPCDLQHPSAYCYQGDASDEKILQAFVNFALEKLGRIDILIHNACVSRGGIDQCSSDEFRHALQLGLVTPYILTQLCLPQLRKNKGNIVNLSSSRAFQSEPQTESYSTIKGGITALTHSLAVSLGPAVRVNAIAPGWIDVEETAEFSMADSLQIPAGRVGKPEDIAAAVLFITSDQASFYTGETMVIDGGMSKQMIYSGDHGWSYTPQSSRKKEKQ